jgi:DNA-binding PadR family transcriptional regulator
MHGYDLYKLLRQPGGLSMIWHINQSNLYAMLDKFVKEGYLTSQLIIVESSHSRKDFSITPKGLDAFQSWMLEPVQRGREMRQLFMAKLYFALKTGNSMAEKLVNAQYQWVSLWEQEIQTKMDGINREQDYERLVLQSRKLQVSAWRKLLDQCKTEII